MVSNYVTSGGTAKVTLHYGDLKTNTTYAFRTSAYDGSLYETDWSAWAKFKTRGRAVDIKLPEPNKSAPAVDLDKYQEPQLRTRNRPEVTRAAKDAGKGSETCTDHGQKITCIGVGKPSDSSAKEQQDVANKLRAGSGDLVPWCDDTGVSGGKDYLKRDSACLKWATPIVFKYKVKAPDGNIYNPADAALRLGHRDQARPGVPEVHPAVRAGADGSVHRRARHHRQAGTDHHDPNVQVLPGVHHRRPRVGWLPYVATEG